jgi:hypothetical protein
MICRTKNHVRGAKHVLTAKHIKSMPSIVSILRTGFLLSGVTLTVQAGSFSSDFNSGALPAGSHTNANANGGAYLELTGGVGNSGCLKLTKSINSQNGSLILDDLDAGQPIYGFDATFKLRIGGGSTPPADGMSFSVGPTLADTTLFGEGGAGGGLSFDWDIYDNPDNPPSPQINVRVAGGLVAWKGYTTASIQTGGTDANTWWADVHIHLNPDGSLNMDYRGTNVFTNFFIPNYQLVASAGVPVRFGLGARTGGLNGNQWIDNLQITTFTTPMVGISQQPFSQTAQQGDDIQFDVRVANTNGVTYQWFSNNVAIAGATSQTLMIANVQASASGSSYKVTATGPNNAVTSSTVTLTVTNLTIPAPQLAFDFNDGLTPAAATLVGTAFIDNSGGGVTNSPCLKLVSPAGSGIILVTNSTEAGNPVFGFIARYKIFVGGGTVPPADGFAFAFGNDIPDAPSGNFEEGIGLGTNLQVTFDIYPNDPFGYTNADPQPAPSIDVRLAGQVLATKQLPLSFMETGYDPADGITPLYRDVIIQLNVDGTLNVVYHGTLVYDHLPIPFASITGGRFAIAARTGSLNDNIWVDNIELTSITTSGPIRITSNPVNQLILVNHAVTNTVAVNDPVGAAFQWYRNGTTLIGGATSSSYVIPSVALSDSGATFTAVITKSSVSVTSTPALLTVANLTAPVSPNLTFNFNDGLLPAGTAIYSGAGGGYISLNGGVADSGVLHITDSANGESGAFVVSNLYNGAQVSAIAASWDVRLGGGSGNPADGYSFNFANNLVQGVSGGENGVGSGISVCFDIYGGLTDNPPAPNVNIRYKGNLVASTQIPKPQLETGSDFRTVLLRVDADGKLYLAYGERVIYNGLQLPNYTFTSAGQFGFYGRTGGENENQWIDNIQIKATQSSGPLTISTQPADITVLAGSNATFSVLVSDPNGATYQWSKNSVNIGGATTSTYTTPPTVVGDNGALFKVVVTGPSGTATSSNAVLTVVARITITSPIIAYDFNDCLQPPGTTLNGSAYIDCNNLGVTNSGVLHLTDAIGSQGGAFIIPDPNNNQPINAITAYFAARIADGNPTPADGFAFVWCPSNNIPAGATWGQNGIGNGLIVSADTYINVASDPEAPSFNAYWNGALVAKKLVPLDAIYTGNYNPDPTLQYADCFVRVNSNGTLDMQYHGNVIFNHLVLPGYFPIAGGVFAFGGATGGSWETHWLDNIQIATTVGANAPSLGFSRNGNNLSLTWPAGFKLQSTLKLNPSTWTDVTATSPYTAPNTNSVQFFRLVSTP